MPVACLLFLAVLLTTRPAQAHFPWINLADYTPDAGAGLKMSIGWGHHYPLDGFLKMDALESVALLASSPSWAHGTRRFTEKAEGIRVVASYDDGEPMRFAAVEVSSPETGAGCCRFCIPRFSVQPSAFA